MTINFPDPPVAAGTQFTAAGVTWTYDGTKWEAIGNNLPLQDAPGDGQTYGRKSGSWSIAAAGSNAISDAPSDGTSYARKNAAWTHLTHTDITDWSAQLSNYALTTSVPAPSSTYPIIDGTAAIGTLATFARADHVHPTDTTRYAASNPSGYQTAANVTAALAPYALITSVPLGSSTAPLMDGTSAAGVGTTWARADHIHPTDTSRYAASNPAGYLTDAANDGTAYARRSAAWSHLTHADITDWSTTISASLSGYLPLAGGVLTGTLRAATPIQMTPNTSGNCYVAFVNSAASARYGYVGYIVNIDGTSGGISLENDTAGTSLNVDNDGWVRCDAAFWASSTIETASNISASGNISCGGNMSCGTINAQLSTGGSVTAGGITSTGNLQVNGSAQVNGNLSCNNTVTGYTGNFSYSTIYGNIQVNGTCTTNGDVNAGGNSFCHGAFYCDAAGGGFFHRDSGGNLGMQIYCNTSNNIATWVNNRTGMDLTQDQNSYFNCSTVYAFKPGGGSWYASSDRRVKNVLGRYTAGLKEVLKLEPVEFIYKGNEATSKDGKSLNANLARDKKKMVGYVADDIMKVLPETVSLTKGFIDGKEVDDLKIFDATNVVHALVNAIKELHARVAQLEAARS